MDREKPSPIPTKLLGFAPSRALDREPTLLLPGEIVDQRYCIQRELGRGGIGVVYLAHDQKLDGMQVVIKVLSEGLDAEQREWFERKFREEIKALARIDHPGVVRGLDVGELPSGRPYIVMQFVAGVSLRAMIQHNGMDLPRAASLIRQIGRALSSAHQRGVLHRDLKPENVMIELVDRDEHVRLIDFGVATVLDTMTLATSRTTVAAGTVHYMAPEQLQGRVSAASDVYSMGVMAFEMVTGHRPFNPDSPYQLLELQRAGVRVKPSDLRPGVPEAAQALILRALSFSTHDRPRGASEFGDALAAALSAEPAHEATQEGLHLAHVLFTGIADYRELPVDQQAAWLERLQDLLRNGMEYQTALNRGVLIRRPLSDGVALAFIGDDPLAAVRCAVELADAMAGVPDMSFRIGVHTGPVKLIRDLIDQPSVSGDTISAAQRVAECGDAGHTLLSASVAGLLGNLSEWSHRVVDLGEYRLARGYRAHVFGLQTGQAGSPPLHPSRIAKPRRRMGAAALAVVIVIGGVMIWRGLLSGGEAKQERRLSYSLVMQTQAKKPRRASETPPAQVATVPDTVFGPGDRVRIDLISPQDGCLYVINERPVQGSGPREFNLLFPSLLSRDSSAEVKANQSVRLPKQSERPELDWFKFDEEEGTEKVWIVWSVGGIAELEGIRASADPAEGGQISSPDQVKVIADYLETHSTVQPATELDEANKRVTIRARGSVVLGLLKLEHKGTRN